jgi:hypothetical protein
MEQNLPLMETNSGPLQFYYKHVSLYHTSVKAQSFLIMEYVNVTLRYVMLCFEVGEKGTELLCEYFQTNQNLLLCILCTLLQSVCFLVDILIIKIYHLDMLMLRVKEVASFHMDRNGSEMTRFLFYLTSKNCVLLTNVVSFSISKKK